MSVYLTCVGYTQPKGNEELFKKEFNKVADVYEKTLRPYLLKFATNQFKGSSNTIEQKQLIDSYYRIYLQKMEKLRSDGYTSLLQQFPNQKIGRIEIIDYFDFSYRVQFTGLDYEFFESCAEDLK